MTTRAFMFKIILPTMVLVAFAYWFFAAPSGERTLRRFDPDRMAYLELQMWKAYYAKERLPLFELLVTMLHEQYRYSWAVATAEGFHLARAAATFGSAKDHYERVLPDLTKGYSTAKNWLHAGFDPAAVARAELSWWVARRTKGRDAPENVGSLMADAYALLYEAPRSSLLNAAVLRARAAKLRDTQAQQPDWKVIEELLKESYRELHTALNKAQ